MNAHTAPSIRPFDKKEHYDKARAAHAAMDRTQLVMLLTRLAHSAEEAEHGSQLRKQLLTELDAAQDEVISRMS